jgi:hypothetical protein
MQGPLKFLYKSLLSDEMSAFPLPDTFLNGSAPCLQYLALEGISFPSLPRFLSSTSDLTSLCLFSIRNSDSGYIPPETMATCLSALPKLETLVISFDSPTRRPPVRSIRSHCVGFQRCERVPGSPRSPNRCTSTRSIPYKVLPSARL